MREKTSNNFGDIGKQLESLRQHDCQSQAEKVLYSRSHAEGLRERIRTKDFSIKDGTHATTSAIPFTRRAATLAAGGAGNDVDHEDGLLGDDLANDDQM
jgi:hypothetical protein